MALAANELQSGGFVRDPDGRLVVIGDTAGLPTGATPLVNASGNKAAATATATLTPSATTTAYITGFEVTGSGATAASVVLVTVTGTLSGTLTYVLTVPAGVTTAVQPLQVEFSSPVPASAVNTPIAVVVPSLGAGSTNAAAVAHGFQL